MFPVESEYIRASLLVKFPLKEKFHAQEKCLEAEITRRPITRRPITDVHQNDYCSKRD